MSTGDFVDLIAILIILIAIGTVIAFMYKKDKNQIDVSVSDKYMQLMAAFIRGKSSSIIEMSHNRVVMKIQLESNEEEYLSIERNRNAVQINWSLTSETSRLSKKFSFREIETQEEIMKVLLEGITEAKKDRSYRTYSLIALSRLIDDFF